MAGGRGHDANARKPDLLSGLASGAGRWPAMAAAFGLGVLAATGQAPFGLWPMTLAALAGIGALIAPIARPIAGARVAWAAGAGYFALALVWIVEPFLVDLARYGWMAPFAIVLMAGGLALFWGLGGYLAVRLAPPRSGARMLALALGLGLGGLLRSYVFTGFPWALIGHVWIGTPVMQLAALTGAHGLSLLALLAALLPIGFRWRGAGAALFLALSAWGYGLWAVAQPIPERATQVQVRLVQPNAAQHLKWRPDMVPVFYQRLLSLTAAPGPMPDLVIWPETALPWLLERAAPALEEIARAAGNTPVVLGIQRRDTAGVYNSLAVIGAGGAVQSVYDKAHLVPFGEYMPLERVFARLGVFGLATDGFGYTPGPGPALIDLGKAGQALPLICYELVFPQDIRNAPGRPDWVLQITNDAWFGSFSGPYQHLAQARLRAVEFGLPVLRSANTGVSAAIDARGRVTAELPLNSAGQITVTLPAAPPPTAYARTGDVPVALLVLAALAGLLLRAHSIPR